MRAANIRRDGNRDKSGDAGVIEGVGAQQKWCLNFLTSYSMD